MKFVVIAFRTAGVLLAATSLLHGADDSGRGQMPAGSIIITNKTDGSAPTRGPYLSAGIPEIMKMHKAGVDASVLLAFIQSSPVAYNPSAREIIYLRDSGISNDLISAMLRRGGELRDRAAEAHREERARSPAPPASQPAAPAPANPAPPQSSVPPPAVAYANPPYSAYTWPVYYSYASYPAYRYGYYNSPYYRGSCYPSVSAGFRWGCNPSHGLSVGFGSGGFSAWGIAYRGGYHAGYRPAYHGGYRYAGGSYCRR